MKPTGLMYKPDGELMVVHMCQNCGKVTYNRIAGDDNPYVLICLLDESCSLNKEIISSLANQGIRLLNQDDKKNVLTILYGYTM